MFLARTAWAVEIHDRAGNEKAQLIVDAETGRILQQRDDAKRRLDEWVKFVAGEQCDDALFT